MRLRRSLAVIPAVLIVACGPGSSVDEVPTSVAPAASSVPPSTPDQSAPPPAVPPAIAPQLIGLPLGSAQSRAGAEGVAIQPTRLGGGPPDPACPVVDQQPKPGQLAVERVVEVLIQCPQSVPVPPPN